MRFIDKFETVKVSRAALNSLGLPKKHRCMKCGANHRIVWEHVRFQDGVIDVGITRCLCGDEVTSFFSDDVSKAMAFAEDYSKNNPVKRKW